MFRFSICTLLVVVTAAGVLLGWKVRQVKRQKEAVAWVKQALGLELTVRTIMTKSIREALTGDSPLKLEDLSRIPPAQLLAEIDRCYDPEDVAIQENIFLVCERLLGPAAEPWLRKSKHRPLQNFAFDAFCSALDVCVPDGGFEIATDKLANERPHQLAYFAHGLLAFDDKTKILDWIEARLGSGNEPVVPEWGQLAALAGVRWQTINRWLDRGKPVSLVALDAIVAWLTGHVEVGMWLNCLTPRVVDTPPSATIRNRLLAHAESEGTPRVEKVVAQIVELIPRG